MTRNKACQLLTEWISTHNELDKHSEALRAIIGGSDFYESPAMKAFWEQFSQYTKVLAELLGCHEDILNWFWLENSMGKKAMLNQGGLFKKPRRIRSVTNLLDLIGVQDERRKT